MHARERGSILASLLGILLCGGAGGVVAWWLVTALGMDGVVGATLAAVVGMVAATALWVGATTLLRAFGVIR